MSKGTRKINTDTCVITIMGAGPGSGKTSILNMLHTQLQSHSRGGVENTVSIISSDECALETGSINEGKILFYQRLAKSLERPGIVILDKNFPNMDGLKALKKRIGTANLLIILPKFTKRDTSHYIERIMQREPGTHTLTSENLVMEEIEKYFYKPCLSFVKDLRKMSSKYNYKLLCTIDMTITNDVATKTINENLNTILNSLSII